MVQIDSLFKFENIEAADLIILDEVESIQEQMTACKFSTEVFDSFLGLLKQKSTIVCMDAMLQIQTVNTLSALSTQDVEDTVYNTYKPYNNHNISVHEFHPNDKSKVDNLMYKISETVKSG